MGYLLSATRHSSTVANSSCEALEQPHIGHQKKKKERKEKKRKQLQKVWVWLLATQKPKKRQEWWKVCFISEAGNRRRVLDSCIL